MSRRTSIHASKMRVMDKPVIGFIRDLSNKPRWAITSLAGRQPGLDRIGADRLCGVRGPMRLRRNHATRGDVVIVWIIVVRLGEACGHAGVLWRVYTGATM